MNKYLVSYEKAGTSQNIIVDALNEEIAEAYFKFKETDARFYGVREAYYSEVMKPGIPLLVVPEGFELDYHKSIDSKTEYPVYLSSGQGTKKLFSVCKTEQEAKDLCSQYNWQYMDENNFVWAMEYDERETEQKGDVSTCEVLLFTDDYLKKVKELGPQEANAIILALYQKYAANSLSKKEILLCIDEALQGSVSDLESVIHIGYIERDKEKDVNISELPARAWVYDTNLDVKSYMDSTFFEASVNSLLKDGVLRVERLRGSVTQGEAAVYCNNETIVQYGDPIYLRTDRGTLVNGFEEIPNVLEPGEYGPILDGWGSIKSDFVFASAAVRQYPKEIYKVLLDMLEKNKYPCLSSCKDFNAIKHAFSKEMLAEIEEAIYLYDETDLLVVDEETNELYHREGKDFFKPAVEWYAGFFGTKDFISDYGDNLDYKLYQSAKGSFRGRNLEEIKQYVRDGADVNYKFMPEEFGYSPFFWAAHNSDIAVMKFLKDSGADINAFDTTGKTPLDFAIKRHNDKPVVDFLVSNGAKRGEDLHKEQSSLTTKLLNAEKKVNNAKIHDKRNQSFFRE